MTNRLGYFFVLIIFSQCTHKMNVNASLPLPAFDKEGHRGCRGLMPENTIAAYLKAIDLGVTTLEMDAVITKDGEVVVSHEPFFNHVITTKPDGSFINEAEEKEYNIYTMPYAEVKQFDVGLKPNPRFPHQQKMPAVKPLLKDVIDSVEAYTIKNKKQPLFYNIETKCLPEGDGIFHPKPDVFVDLLMKVINSKDIAGRVIIQSFDMRSLQYLHKQFPSIKTSLLIDEGDTTTLDKQIAQLGFVPTIYSPEQSLVTRELVQQCHAKGMKVVPWTVDNVTAMKLLIDKGVDGLISDYPNLFAELNVAKSNAVAQ